MPTTTTTQSGKAPTMTNPTKTIKISPNRGKTGPSGASHRAKQTQFHHPEIDRKGLSPKRLRRISPQTPRAKQTQSKPIPPPRPTTPVIPAGPSPEPPGASIDRMSLESHTKGSFCRSPDAAPDNPMWKLGLGGVPVSPARPGEGGSRDRNER